MQEEDLEDAEGFMVEAVAGEKYLEERWMYILP
jgi:hypothetical protein